MVQHDHRIQPGIKSRLWKLFRGWRLAYTDILQFIRIVQSSKQPPVMQMVLLIASMAVTWFIYVPIHELLHVAGCLITGGTVSELIMGREYGADFLKHIFPFITPQTSQYAGRLTGFVPSGDFGYFITDISPFFLSIFPGTGLLLLFNRTRNLIFAGPGLILGLAPFMNLTGDYFEMGTILSTRWIDLLFSGRPSNLIENYYLLRSDDIFRLFGEIAGNPSNYGMQTLPGIFFTSVTVILGALLAVLLCGWTYHLGRWIALKTFITPAEISE